jgi:CoA:oxalate CoA-transferase
VPAAPIQSVDRVLTDPQVMHRKMVVDLVHERHGHLPTLGTPVKVDGALGLKVTPPPRLGEHTDEVLGRLVGYSGDRIEELRREGAIP